MVWRPERATRLWMGSLVYERLSLFLSQTGSAQKGQSRLSQTLSLSLFFNVYLFGSARSLIAACGIFDLRRGMWDLVP